MTHRLLSTSTDHDGTTATCTCGETTRHRFYSQAVAQLNEHMPDPEPGLWDPS